MGSIWGRFGVDLGPNVGQLSRRFWVDFETFGTILGPTFLKTSLSGVVNSGLQIAFQKRAQKRLKTPKKLSPHWVFSVHPDLPAGTPCYNFTKPIQTANARWMCATLIKSRVLMSSGASYHQPNADPRFKCSALAADTNGHADLLSPVNTL